MADQKSAAAPPVSLLEDSMALWSGYQMGPQVQTKRVERKDFLGMVARADHAPLGAVELDVLTWMTARWWARGRNPEGVVRFTLYAVKKAMYGSKVSDHNNDRIKEALDNLKAIVVTVNGVNVRTGAKAKFSKVNLLDSIVLADQIALFDERDEYDAVAVGGMRQETVEVVIAPWLVRQLLSAGGISLDWNAQRRLKGRGKRLWIHLASSVVDWTQDSAASTETCLIGLTADVYSGLGISCGRPYDNKMAVVRAAKQLLADDSYVEAGVEPGPSFEIAHVLRVTRKIGTGEAVDPPRGLSLV